MWTKFFDMASGGSEKTPFSTINIELPEDEAREYFEEKFGINPNNVTCHCCGEDFSVYEITGEPEAKKGVLCIDSSMLESFTFSEQKA